MSDREDIDSILRHYLMYAGCAVGHQEHSDVADRWLPRTIRALKYALHALSDNNIDVDGDVLGILRGQGCT